MFTNKCPGKCLKKLGPKGGDHIAPWGPKGAILSKNDVKSKKKEANLSKDDDFLEVVQVPGISKKKRSKY